MALFYDSASTMDVQLHVAANIVPLYRDVCRLPHENRPFRRSRHSGFHELEGNELPAALENSPARTMRREITRDRRVIGEEYYSVAEVAAHLGISRYTVTRRFATFPGVIDNGWPETLHKRRYRELLIPRSALNEFLRQRRVKSGK